MQGKQSDHDPPSSLPTSHAPTWSHMVCQQRTCPAAEACDCCTQAARDALARLHGSPSAPRNVATAAKVESPAEYDAPPKLQRTVLDSLVRAPGRLGSAQGAQCLAASAAAHRG